MSPTASVLGTESRISSKAKCPVGLPAHGLLMGSTWNSQISQQRPGPLLDLFLFIYERG